MRGETRAAAAVRRKEGLRRVRVGGMTYGVGRVAGTGTALAAVAARIAHMATHNLVCAEGRGGGEFRAAAELMCRWNPL